MAKKLLNEAVVRRFQSLANISPINEMYKEEKDEEKMEEAMHDDEDKMEESTHPGDFHLMCLHTWLESVGCFAHDLAGSLRTYCNRIQIKSC